MMEAHESDGGVDQNDEVAVFLKSYTPEGAVGFALHLRDGYKRENADLLAKVEQLEAERSKLRNKVIEELVEYFESQKGLWSTTQINNRIEAFKTK